MSSRQMALCGVLSALAVVLLLTGSIIPLATFCAPLLAMVALLPILLEYGPRAAGTVYVAVSILALLLASDRELTLVYAAFGWYPLLRSLLMGRKLSRPVRLAVQLVLCNLVVALLYGVVLRVMGMALDLLEGARWMNIAMLVMANFIFLTLDVVLDRMGVLWKSKFGKRFFK